MSVPATAAWLAIAALVVGCAAAPAEPMPDAQSLKVSASPVELGPGRLRGLRLLRAVELDASHPEVGGLSGLLFDGERLLAVTDRGWLLSAQLHGGDGLRLDQVEFAPLPGHGDSLKESSDAESLAWVKDGIAVGFERDHRIKLFANGRHAGEIRHRSLVGEANEGPEALATLPDGALLAIRETPEPDGTFPVLRVAPDGGTKARMLALPGGDQVTGADIGPDRRLYLLRRDFSFLKGLSMRIERYWLGEDGFPRPETREELAFFDSATGIDNMEGIAAWRTPDGAIRLLVVADDNYNRIQRSLLLQLEAID